MTATDLDMMAALFKKRFKNSSIVDVTAAPKQGATGEYLPTGSPSLDLAIGVGGFKLGTVNEIYGDESSGKSTLTASVVREAQLMFTNKPAVIVDVEHAVNLDYYEAIGIDLSPDRFKLVQESETETALNMAQFFAEQGASIVVVDSVAAMVPQAQLESGDSVDAKMGGNAKFLSTHLPKMIGVCAKTDTIAVYVNQVREKLGVMFGNPETTTGGRALRFYSSLRIKTRIVERLKDSNGDVNGVMVEAQVLKNKIGGAPYRKAKYPILFGVGIDRARDLGDLAIEKGLLGAGSGGRFSLGETKLHGKEAVYQYLRDNATAVKVLTDTIWGNT